MTRHDLAAAKRQDRSKDTAAVGHDTQGARGLAAPADKTLDSTPLGFQPMPALTDDQYAEPPRVQWRLGSPGLAPVS